MTLPPTIMEVDRRALEDDCPVGFFSLCTSMIVGKRVNYPGRPVIPFVVGQLDPLGRTRSWVFYTIALREGAKLGATRSSVSTWF